MEIKICGASENNLKSIDVEIYDGLTVVTGVSGSGKTSLVFDTLYHEARRKFLEVFNPRSWTTRMPPADVRSISGLGPTVAVGQNLLNRNPNSTLASASGLHPFLRLLFSRFASRYCRECNRILKTYSEDEVVSEIRRLAKNDEIHVLAPLVISSRGSHRTLLSMLKEQFGTGSILVNETLWDGESLDVGVAHTISLLLTTANERTRTKELRETVDKARSLGADSIRIGCSDSSIVYPLTNSCPYCGTWSRDVEPKHFRMKCQFCDGEGCEKCRQTGIHPEAASTRWHGLSFTEVLSLSVAEAKEIFRTADIPVTASRLISEINRRLKALETVGLGYIDLDRSSPTLSRGESQRVRLAVALTSKLEDIVHVLDEPTIGQHPSDVKRLMPALRQLLGSVIFVEHDNAAAAEADWAIDIGPGAGEEGGEIVFTGTPQQLWEAETTTGRFFSQREEVPRLGKRNPSKEFITIHSAYRHNLDDITVKIPLGSLTVITGVSGSGKSTLVEHVLVPSLKKKEPVGCKEITGKKIRPVIVDQSPIGRNPRSNPGTYTKLSDILRDLFESETTLTKSHFSFNRPEGACPTCKGMGATEVKMRFLASTWIPCSDCGGRRFNDTVLEQKIEIGGQELSIADIYDLSISDVHQLVSHDSRLPDKERKAAGLILDAMVTTGLGYLRLGQSSPSLSGGEAQRVKLAKYLGKRSLSSKILVLDEPSTGLHPSDLFGLISVLDRLVQSGATIVIVEHNTDLIRSADWIVDLGPGAGPAGGRVLYQGSPDGLVETKESLTAKALVEEREVAPTSKQERTRQTTDKIAIKKATANNLQSVSVEIEKQKLTVVTGVSGSGKSSLVRDVLHAEAERRYLESLSVYERQNTSEGPEAPVESVSGLGVTVSITGGRGAGGSFTNNALWSIRARRATVGSVTGLSQHLYALFAAVAERTCTECGTKMIRKEMWYCEKCGSSAKLATPRLFSPTTYKAACDDCHGIGYNHRPAPEKLIIHKDRPICDGAMYSPGYFPGKYFCEEKSAAAGLLRAVGKKYGFDPTSTPWDEMTLSAQEAFLFGDPEKLEYSYIGTKRGKKSRVTKKGSWFGFYGINLQEWDVGETFTHKIECGSCRGTGLKSEYLAYTLCGHDVYHLKSVSISELKKVLESVTVDGDDDYYASENLAKSLRRLSFLDSLGLGYLDLSRVAGTLSAGEAQRILLSSLLGSGLTSLTVLMDEPTRGMHPSEVGQLVGALEELRDDGNTVVVVEHDPVFIKAADLLIDVGPGPGEKGGRIVARGTPSEVMQYSTITTEWLDGTRRADVQRPRRQSTASMVIKGASGNNLKDIDVGIPLSALVGICGVSGSGKSTLLIDTLARALAPKKHTTSMAPGETIPEDHESIEGAPERVVVLDQASRRLRSPGRALGIIRHLRRLYVNSEDAHALGLSKKAFSRSCSVCKGRGRIRTKLGFLPTVYTDCETCAGSGLTQEIWDVRVNGYTFPGLYEMTLNELYSTFKGEERLEWILKTAIDVGLGYLVLKQPSVTLSGGEVQRLKIVQELVKKRNTPSLFILDEPTVGQHLDDVNRLIGVLHRLVDEGHSVVVIEHHSHLLAACDWLIELGPKGGPQGGHLIAEGTPEEIAEMDTPTAPYIRSILEGGL